jgi:hypothetical protein
MDRRQKLKCFQRIALLTVIVLITLPGETWFGGGMAWPSSTAAPETLRTLESFQRAITDQKLGERQASLYSSLFQFIESGELQLKQGPELDQFMAFLASQLEKDRSQDSGHPYITEFLAKHPHPAARDALWQSMDRSSEWEKKRIKSTLVALGDERVLDLLLADVRLPGAYDWQDAFRMIGELGSARAMEPLEAILADSSLELGHDRDRKWYLETTQTRARSYRDAAQRALRDVRLRVDTGMVMPFDLDDHALTVLSRQGFVILPEPADELYENLGSEYPYVTVDIAFHAFMILVRASLQDLERLIVRPRLSLFASGMVEAGREQLSCLEAGEEVSLARKNIAIFAAGDGPSAAAARHPGEQSQSSAGLAGDRRSSGLVFRSARRSRRGGVRIVDSGNLA